MPQPPNSYDTSAWSGILDFLKRSMLPVVSKDEATTRILLLSPNRTVYALTVDDAGNLITTLEDGKSGT